jgi:methionyl-tRNA formyltransferase
MPVPQDHASASYARKIKKENGRLRWSEPPETALRMLRAYYPWPGVWFEAKIGSETCHVKVTDAALAEGVSGSPGAVVGVGREEIVVGCGAGAISIRKLVPQGRKEMTGAEFARGCRSIEIQI